MIIILFVNRFFFSKVKRVTYKYLLQKAASFARFLMELSYKLISNSKNTVFTNVKGKKKSLGLRAGYENSAFEKFLIIYYCGRLKKNSFFLNKKLMLRVKASIT